MIRTGLDRLLDEASALDGRRYAVASHWAAASTDLVPIHLALTRRSLEAPAFLLGPEHGFFGVEQDMVSAVDSVDPWTGVPIISLYGESAASLRPKPEAFADVDLLIVDFQDVGTRYYTYAATALWAVMAALDASCEVWILDRPNPLGGEVVEGNLPQPGFESFVGAFDVPVRHGMTLAELIGWGLAAHGRDDHGVSVWTLVGWRRDMSWRATGRCWLAPSPNLPTPRSARIYPGGCLVEATTISEGRGTTRPFELIGSPSLDPVALADRLNSADLPGARFLPVYFRPGYQKHADAICAGVQWVVEDAELMRPYRCGVEVVRALSEIDPDFGWRRQAYEFVRERPAVDLLAGSDALRLGVEGVCDLDEWIDSWEEDETAFRRAREPFLLYPQSGARD